MYSGLLLAAGLGYYLFVYKGIEGSKQQQQHAEDQSAYRFPTTQSEAMQAYLHARMPWNSGMGDTFVYSRFYPDHHLPTVSKRQLLFRQFSRNVRLLREAGRVPSTPIRFIDKVDLNLDLTTVKSMKIADAKEKYLRQMRTLSMYDREANPFPTIRELIMHTSVYARPTEDDFPPSDNFVGTFPLFLQDYYFSLYLPNRQEWQLYVLKQKMALNEVERDVFKFLNPQEIDQAADENGEVTATFFSTIGIELITDLLRPTRTVTPQLEAFQQAFTDEIWKNYFPFTWAEVNRRAAKKDVYRWVQSLNPEERRDDH